MLVISAILSDAAAQVDSHVERQPLFSEPRRVQDRYAAGEDSGDDAGKVSACAVQVDMLLLPALTMVLSHGIGANDGCRAMYCCCCVQAFVSLNWVLAEEPLDLETELALDFLDYLLVHTSL